MIKENFIQSIVNTLVFFATDILMPTMVFVFCIGAVLRILNYLTLKRQEFFTKEFDKRIDNYLEEIEEQPNVSFFQTAKKLLLITYYEIFEVTAILQRRKPDMIMSLGDRVFLNKQGFAWLVKNSLKQMRHIKREENHHPPFLDVSKSVFQNNPAFTKIFGYIPSGFTNDFLNILPGMFIIGGIFGTFLGIMQALPDLSSMNPDDVEGAKKIMDAFLFKVSFSMSTSIIGITLSIGMSLLNTALSADRLFLRTIDNYENCLNRLWNRSTNNDIPSNSLSFDEHKNPLEALAEEALDKEYLKMRKKIYTDDNKHQPHRDEVPKAS
ncbi:MAG: hypothetical protein H6625_03035 [Bdellovibrionaceae bacterium]|nr:hypothetical protein [Pseudobdellovibrionaceae bacterium]